jgi:hypothetical protein
MMKPRIRRQTTGWAIEQGTLLVAVHSTFAGACALAGEWTRGDLIVV